MTDKRGEVAVCICLQADRDFSDSQIACSAPPLSFSPLSSAPCQISCTAVPTITTLSAGEGGAGCV